jgi:hypothetical protein
MSMRFWTRGSKGEIIYPTSFLVLPGLPKGLRREDASSYLLSNTYARVLGTNIPRRQILLGLAASIAATSVPLRPARAIPLAAIGIAAVAVGAAAIKVFRSTWGSFDAENNERKQEDGYVEITVTDDDSGTVEGSITAHYSFPANTTATFHFTSGPAATTKGSKTLEVAASDSSDSDSFEAVT